MMNHALDELALQRLVDDEMSGHERDEFLTLLDQQPGGWREVALAFVENQVWQRELPSAQNPRKNDAVADGSRRQRSSPAVWATLAVTVLIGLVVAFRLGEIKQQAELAAQPKAKEDQQDDVAPDDEEVTPPQRHKLATEPPFRVQMVTADGQRIELPAYDENQLEDVPWEPVYDQRVQELNRSLETLGYRLEYKTEYLSGRLDNGRELVVPVRNVAVQYHGQ